MDNLPNQTNDFIAALSSSDEVVSEMQMQPTYPDKQKTQMQPQLQPTLQAQMTDRTLQYPEPTGVNLPAVESGAADTKKETTPCRQADAKDVQLMDQRIMNHLRVYSMFPPVWRLVGAYYRDLDVLGGVLFVLGSFGFFVMPILRNYRLGSSVQLDIALLISVVFFLLAKVALEARAVYAMLWKRWHKRPSWIFHVSILILLCGGIIFLLVPSFSIGSVLPRGRGMLACVSSFLFLLGTGLLTVDGLLQLQKPVLSHVENQYFWGSLILFFGSVLFVAAGLCVTRIGEVIRPDGSSSYRNGSVCNEDMVNWLNGIGGLLFTIGSICFLVFANAERLEMHNGPDPRILTRHGKEEPHPYRHELWHLHSANALQV